MKVGIKVGPTGWQKILSKTKPDCCEIWFRLDWYKQYLSLFKYLNKQKIPFGLHFWATVDGKYFPNLLGLHDQIAEKTFLLIKQTIDIANKWQASYVNFHPESYRLNLLDLDKKTITTLNPNELIDRKKSFKQLLFYLKKIRNYTNKKKVIPFLETVPKYVPANFHEVKKGRANPQHSEGLETEKFFELSKSGYPICFDIGHTTAQCIINDRKKLFNYLMNAVKKMMPTIGLVHITTTIPPFEGTDSHNGILEKDFKKNIFPNKKQFIQFLSLFKDKDVWLIPEPQKEEMAANFFSLKKIVTSLVS